MARIGLRRRCRRSAKPSTSFARSGIGPRRPPPSRNERGKRLRPAALDPSRAPSSGRGRSRLDWRGCRARGQGQVPPSLRPWAISARQNRTLPAMPILLGRGLTRPENPPRRLPTPSRPTPRQPSRAPGWNRLDQPRRPTTCPPRQAALRRCPRRPLLRANWRLRRRRSLHYKLDRPPPRPQQRLNPPRPEALRPTRRYCRLMTAKIRSLLLHRLARVNWLQRLRGSPRPTRRARRKPSTPRRGYREPALPNPLRPTWLPCPPMPTPVLAMRRSPRQVRSSQAPTWRRAWNAFRR